MAARVESAVQEIQPESIEPVADDRLHRDEALARDPDRLVEDAPGIIAMVQGEEQHGRVEGAIAKRQARAVVHDVGAGHPAKGADVARAREPAAPGREQGPDVALAGSQVQDA